MAYKCLNIIGKIDVDLEFNTIFSTKTGHLITPICGDDAFFEMSGESMYLYLQGLNDTISKERKEQVINALIDRINFCGGKLEHKSSKGGFDLQLRASSAAIRTLLYAYKDGFDTLGFLRKLVNEHYVYKFKVFDDAYWFCHDSSEYNNDLPKTYIKRSKCGTVPNNAFIINTHLDSLNTLLLLKIHNISNFSFDLDDYILKGIRGLQYSFSYRNKFRVVQKLDEQIMNFSLKHECTYSILIDRILHSTLFKLLSPCLYFDNGFIGRDLSVVNRHLDYLVVNIVDFARYYLLIHRSPFFSFASVEEIKGIILKAVNLIQTNKLIREKIEANDIQRASLAEMYFLVSKIDKSVAPLFNKYKQTREYSFFNYYNA